MLRFVLIGLSVLVVLVGVWALMTGPAEAQPTFKPFFDEKYFPKEGDTAMKKAHTMSSCNFCHIGGATNEERKNRNAYGQALAKRLNAKDAMDLSFASKLKTPDVYKKAQDKIRKALDAVEKEPSDPKDKKSPTFGDLLKEGKLPKSPDKLPGK
jgi:hypothetical protein